MEWHGEECVDEFLAEFNLSVGKKVVDDGWSPRAERRLGDIQCKVVSRMRF